MAFESRQEREKLNLFVRALQNAGMRAVIQGFNKSLEGYELPGTMLSCGAAPHSWLFRQGGCVIHHCGFGTSAAAMLYGAPSVPVPHVLDQFAFAQRLYELGVGVEPVRADALSEQRLTRALEQVKDQREALAGRAAALSRKMRAENGLEKAVDVYKRQGLRLPRACRRTGRCGGTRQGRNGLKHPEPLLFTERFLQCPRGCCAGVF